MGKGWHIKSINGPVEEPDLDVLWVIDNSESMCQEQRVLRDNFGNFIWGLSHSYPRDVHVGVTTTHAGDAPSEKVAEFGALQSTPNVVPAAVDECRFGRDSDGTIDRDDLRPIREQIEAAIECTRDPQKFRYLKNWGEDDIRCALLGDEAPDDACAEAQKNPETFGVEQLFPCANKFGKTCGKSELRQVYREIPKVIRSTDPRYRESDGSVDFQKMKRDFECASFVGTRGSNREQGLRAAVKAVSPEMTGGTPSEPTDESAPNHGLLRKYADLLVVFVTDENDCSHSPEKSNELDAYGCGEMNCYFPTKGDDQAPLMSTDKLADQFMSNLAASKGVEKVPENDVTFASIHGGYKRYDGPVMRQCTKSQQEHLRKMRHVCSTRLGSAASGDRYEDFLKNFSRFRPHQPSSGGHLKGWMCDGRLQPALEDIYPSFERPDPCLRERAMSCDSGDDCPDYQWRESSGEVCRRWGKSDRKYCDSALQARLTAHARVESPAKALRETGICVPGSITVEGLANGCVVKSEAYEWQPCPGAQKDAVQLDWNDELVPDPARQLVDVQLIYAYRTRR